MEDLLKEADKWLEKAENPNLGGSNSGPAHEKTSPALIAIAKYLKALVTVLREEK